MAVEIMLNAVNLVLVTADTTVRATLPYTGGVFALFVIVLAAAEIGVGLAIVLQLYRLRQSVQVDEVALTEPEEAPGTSSGDADPVPAAVSRAGVVSGRSLAVTGTLGAALPLVPFAFALLGFLLRPQSRFAAGFLRHRRCTGRVGDRNRARRHGRRSRRDQPRGR